MIGAIISMVLLIRRASRPHVAFPGRIPGTRRFSDRERHPDNELIAGVLVFRPESSLLYFSLDRMNPEIKRMASSRKFRLPTAASARKIGAMRLSEAVACLKTVPPDGNLARTARALGIALGD